MYKILILLIVVAVIYILVFQPFKMLKTIKVNINNNTINAELAITSTQKTKGLMGRRELDKDSGMLFIFNKESYHTFWMANTYIPLDLIFIDKEKNIVDIIKDVPPCKDIKSLCKLYKPKEKALYVLEVNAGYTDKNNINIGNKITLPKPIY